MSFGSRLRKLRKSRKWTLKDVSAKLQLRGFSTYSNWEYDRTQPDAEMLVRIASIYDITVDDLLDRHQVTDEEREHVLIRLAEKYGIDITNEEHLEKLEKLIQLVFPKGK